jgi:hypothetical protein
MKRPSAFLLVGSVLAILPFAGCEDDPTSPAKDAGTDSPAHPVDGGPLPEVDGSTPDGSVFDAGQDAGPPPVTVVVTKGGLPDQGVNVIFQDASGMLVGTAITGADGTARSPVIDGSQLTVALGTTGNRQLITYLGIKAGDVIKVVEKVSRDVSITQTVFGAGGGDTVVVGNSNCSTSALSTGNLVSIQATSDCISGPTFPILSVLNNAGTYYSFKKDNALAASGTTNVSGLSAWTLGSAFTLNVANAPAGSNPAAYVGQIANNESYATSATGQFTLNAGAGTASFSVATGYADALQGEVQFTAYPQGGFQQITSFAKRIAAAGASSQSLDLSAGMLPGLLSVSATSGVARPVLTWTAASSLASTDGGVVGLSFFQIIDGGTETVDWTFVVPPGTLTVTVPQLPAQLSAFAPSESSVVYTPRVAFFESDLLPGYDMVRANAASFGLTSLPFVAFPVLRSPALPAAGTLRITAIGLGG